MTCIVDVVLRGHTTLHLDDGEGGHDVNYTHIGRKGRRSLVERAYFVIMEKEELIIFEEEERSHGDRNESRQVHRMREEWILDGDKPGDGLGVEGDDIGVCSVHGVECGFCGQFIFDDTRLGGSDIELVLHNGGIGDVISVFIFDVQSLWSDKIGDGR